MLFVELAVVIALIALNGVLAMSELAVVSSRPARLKARAEEGSRGAEIALALTEHPGRFLSTVQIGITLVGILAGAFSGATLAARLGAWLIDRGFPVGAANEVAFALVVGLITYLSLIVGELVPKQIALRNPEGVASAVAPAMRTLSTAAGPLVWLLDKSQSLVLGLLGSRRSEASVTDEEIHTLVKEAETAGVLEPQERQMIAGIMRLADRNVRGLMTPRREVYWLDLEDDEEALRRAILESPHSRLPVMTGSNEALLGVVVIKDVLNDLLCGRPLDVRRVMKPAPTLLDSLSALVALEKLKEAPVPLALVIDEYGHFEGIVTPADILEAIAGTFVGESDGEPAVVARGDGSYLISGSMPADEMADLLRIKLPADRDYQTAAGFALFVTRSVPRTGEVFSVPGWRFEIVDMDGARIDKMLVSPATG